MKQWVALTLAVPLAMLAGCEKKPGGQVVAVVNGEEIGQQELNDEVQQMPAAPASAKKQVVAAALNQIVTRKLLAQEAKKEQVDRTPEFVTRQRKLNETLLIASMVDAETKKLPLPTQAEVDQFIAAHPTVFANRRRLAIQSLVFPSNTDAAVLQKLAPLHTLEAIAATLAAANVQVSRTSGQIDTAALPPQVALKLEQLPQGEPFVLPQGNALTANVIVGNEPVAMTPDQNKPIAIQLIRNERTADLVKRKTKAAQSAGKVTYASGFGPPAAPANAAAAAN